MARKNEPLRNDDGTVGTPVTNEQGTVYCDTCGSDGAPGTISMFHPSLTGSGGTWEHGVPCPMHNARQH